MRVSSRKPIVVPISPPAKRGLISKRRKSAITAIIAANCTEINLLTNVASPRDLGRRMTPWLL